MILPFSTQKAADERNEAEALKRGCLPNRKWWSNASDMPEGLFGLDVGDGDGLTEEEVERTKIDYRSVLDFENWEKRFDAVAQCKTLVNESPITIPDGQGGTLPLRVMIQEWYSNAMTEVNDFLITGSEDFLRLIEEGDEFWWDLVSSEQSGSVRVQAINLIKPLVV